MPEINNHARHFNTMETSYYTCSLAIISQSTTIERLYGVGSRPCQTVQYHAGTERLRRVNAVLVLKSTHWFDSVNLVTPLDLSGQADFPEAYNFSVIYLFMYYLNNYVQP